MFCSQCAHKLTPSDVYCPNCAKPVASFNFDPGQIPQVERIDEETPTVVRPSIAVHDDRKAFNFRGLFLALAAVLVAILAIGLVGFFAYRSGLRARNNSDAGGNVRVERSATPAPSPTATETPTPLPEAPRNLIVNSIFQVGPGELQYFEFETETAAKVTGGFRTTDGGSKDVDVYIVDEKNMERLLEKAAFQSLYTRSKADRGKIDIQIERGEYFVVFSNRHALLTGKEVAAEIYYQER